MNMNKKIFLLIFAALTIFIAFNISENVVAADLKACSSFKEKACKKNRNCQWSGGACRELYVAENPCADNNIKKALVFFGYLLLIAKVAVPLIIIVMGTLDLFKSVVDKDEKSLTKQLKVIGVRIVGGVFIFFIPTLVYAIFNLSSELEIVNDNKYKVCVDCLFEPTKCNTKKS